MKKTISYLLAGALAMGSTAGAVTITSRDVSWDSPRVMTIKGKSDSGKAGEDIVLQILNPTKTKSDIAGSSSDKDVFMHVAQVKTEADGNFTYSFNVTDATTASGDFLIRAKSNKESGTPLEKNINYYSDTVGGDLRTSIANFAAQMGKTTKDTTAISTLTPYVTTDTMKYYFVEYPLFAQVSGAAADIAECITYMTPATTGAQVASAIENATVIAASENGVITVSEAFSTYATELGVNSYPEHTVFSGYSDTYKGIFETFFAGARGAKNVKSTEYQRLFKEAVVLTELKKAGGEDGVKRVLNTYSSHFNLTPLSGSNSSTLCLNVATAFEKDEIDTIQDVQDILDAPVPTPTPDTWINQTPIGGGGGGGGVPKPVLPPVVEAPPVPEEADVPSTDANYNFSDIENYVWASDAIIDLAKSGIISGMDEETFAPEQNLTRAQACTIICKLFAVEEAKAKNGKFSDVTDDDWYSGFVYAAYNNKIVAGMSEDYFGAEEFITRQDYVVMLNRAAETFDTPFGDIAEAIEFIDESSIADYARDSVKKFKGLSIVGGREDGSFDPVGLITRAEAALIAYNVKVIYEGR